MIEAFDVNDLRPSYCHRVFRDEHRRRYRLAAEWLASRLPADRTGRILDAACGYGYGYEYLSPISRYIGVDASRSRLAACRAAYPSGEFYEIDLDVGVPHLLACDGLHAVVSLETAEHLRDPHAFLRNARAALSSRHGWLAFSAPTSLTRDFDRFHLRDWPRDRWRDALRRAGFVIESEIRMPFTCKFTELIETVPRVGMAAVARCIGFDLAHPRYLLDRAANWALRNRFRWESTLWFCSCSHN